MKKTLSLLFICVLVLAAVSALAEPAKVTQVPTISADNTTTAGFRIDAETKFVGIQVPTIASATVTVQVSMDNTTYSPMYADNLVVWSVPASTGNIAVRLPESAVAFRWFKIILGASQTAVKTFNVFEK